jgi:hypothetical protein
MIGCSDLRARASDCLDDLDGVESDSFGRDDMAKRGND